jgi:predicted  nucleic acid-binding Zn-ribbon protein
MADIAEELSTIREQLAVIKITGENTLTECRKTNGRVTGLETSHNDLKTDLAVLRATVGEKIRVLDRDLDDISPKVEENKSFMNTLKGNWQGIVMTLGLIIYIIDKFIVK